MSTTARRLAYCDDCVVAVRTTVKNDRVINRGPRKGGRVGGVMAVSAIQARGDRYMINGLTRGDIAIVARVASIAFKSNMIEDA